MTQKEINEIQKHINSTSGIIIYFTEHLLERVNHTRNSPSIERDELVDTIEKAFKFHGKKIKNLEHLKEFYVKNVDTNLNIIFIVDGGSVNVKTVIRKNEFKSPNLEFRVWHS